MKTVKSVVIAVSLCAAFSFSAFGATSQEQAGQQGQTMRLAYYGGNCWWHHGVKYCRYYHRPNYYQRHYKRCWKGYYGRMHCRYY
jgi:hypothetical protein